MNALGRRAAALSVTSARWRRPLGLTRTQPLRFEPARALPNHHTSIAVRVDSDAEMLEVSNLVAEGEVSRFPFVWLRDNCICTKCFHAQSSSRLTSFAQLELDDRVLHAEPVMAAVQDTRLGRTMAGSKGEDAAREISLRLSWSSGHESTFPVRWLSERCFSDRRQRARGREMDVFELLEQTVREAADGEADAETVRASAVPIRGAREMQARAIPRFRFEELRREPTAMLGWCLALEKYGVALIETKNTPGVLKHFTELFGFREWCSYGEFYVVENKQTPSIAPGEVEVQANNLAYTGLPLAFHTDLPHYASPPQVQLLHCISQCSCDGGANKLVDGFAVAERMRREHPEAFELLATVQMEYKDFHRETLWDAGPGGESESDGTAFGGRPNDTPRLGSRREVDFFLRHAHPIIEVEDAREWRTSRVARINYSDHHRDSVLNNVSAEKVKAYYRACKLWDALLNDDAHVVWSKSAPGDILCFDNRRVLHGRSGFEVVAGEVRKLIGTYLRWDEIRSMARVVASRVAPQALV